MDGEYRIDVADGAIDDLESIVGDISGGIGEPGIAQRLYSRLKSGIQTLSTVPTRIALVRDRLLAAQGFRMLMVENYLVFFIASEAEKTVYIVRILHSRRDWMGILE